MKSPKRQKQQEAKRARKAKSIANPGRKSVYARKLRGEYPPGSPFAPGGLLEGFENVRHINAGGYHHLGRGH
jgi:hypothetical protein